MTGNRQAVKIILDKVHDELLGYIESAGEYYKSVDSFICLDAMVNVILHPAK